MARSEGPQEAEAAQGNEGQQQRIQALRALAGQRASVQEPVKVAAKGRRVQWQFVLPTVVSVVVIVGVALRFALLSPNAPARRSVSPAQPIIPALDRLDCPHDVAWSPDQSRIAVLGYVGDCPSLQGPSGGQHGMDPHISGLVDVYDVASGRLVSQFTPDAAIMSAVQIPPAVTAYEQQTAGNLPTTIFDINYMHLLWSHDGKQFLLTFDLWLPTAPPVSPANQLPYWPGTEMDGVLVSEADGTAPRVMVRAMNGGVPSMVEWDLTTSKSVPLPAPLAPPSTLDTYTPALAYQWGATGQIAPVTPVTASATPPAPVPGSIGNPDGGQAFSIWQPGIASDEVPVEAAGSPLNGPFTWSTDITALSPDGRYLVEHLDIAGFLVSPQTQAPTQSQLAGYGAWMGAPVLPVRDSGLQQIYSTIASNPITSPFLYTPIPIGPNGALNIGVTIFRHGALVAWRPDGRVVAVDAAANDHSVQLYDCATGRLLASLVPLTQNEAHNTPHEQGELNVMRWSPDGSKLLLFDTTLGRVTIWSGAALPH